MFQRASFPAHLQNFFRALDTGKDQALGEVYNGLHLRDLLGNNEIEQVDQRFLIKVLILRSGLQL